MEPEEEQNFQATYKCYSVSMMPGDKREDVHKDGKIYMSPSTLDNLAGYGVKYPMMFKLINHKEDRTIHAGVLQFVANEGRCYLPGWMMNYRQMEEGDVLTLETVSLPVTTLSKFKPLNGEFLDITNPKVVLQNHLRNFACLKTGDVIAIQYNKKIYELRVSETCPENAVSIIERDMNVKLEVPVGYKDPKNQETAEEVKDHVLKEVVEPFQGTGVHLCGKQKKESQMDTLVAKEVCVQVQLDYDY